MAAMMLILMNLKMHMANYDGVMHLSRFFSCIIGGYISKQ